jgi:molybdopterin-guanine dinucleotide biosynthesis protein A
MGSGIILAGGLGTRIGCDKALLPWGDSIILNDIVSQMKGVCDDVILVRNTPLDFEIEGIRVVSDTYRHMGPLAGIHAGLSMACHEYAFVTACDMPHLPRAAIQHLFDEAAGWDVVMPATGRDYEPLFACYSRKCLPVIEGLLQRGVRKIIEILPLVRYRTISREYFLQIDERIFSNINTREQYQSALERAQKRQTVVE